MSEHKDAFRHARQSAGILKVDADERDSVSLLLRLKDVRRAAKDWKTYSSNHPFMVLIHSEAHLRENRQVPIESDPPEHTEYRALIDPLFRQPADPAYIANIRALADERVALAIEGGPIEAVREFALPLQSHALTRLFRMPESTAEEWISWGVRVMEEQMDTGEDGFFLERYARRELARAEANPGDDFFSVLNQSEFQGRKLTLEEKLGYSTLSFAGGRDTIIFVASTMLVHVAEHPETLDFLREDPARILTATEEFVRYVSPITTISRTCPHGATVADVEIPAGERVGLCWPSANRDETIFDRPDEIILDRSPNPHIGFGFGPHACLGSQHARLLLRSLLESLCKQVERIELIDAVPRMEEESSFSRQVGYESATVRFIPLQSAS